MIFRSSIKNRHLAMRLGKFDLTSQRPSPRLRTRGIPNGQRNCNVLMSSPMIRLSAAGSSLSHSRTGSRPADVEKKIIGSCLLSTGQYVSFLVLFASLSSAKHRHFALIPGFAAYACSSTRCRGQVLSKATARRLALSGGILLVVQRASFRITPAPFRAGATSMIAQGGIIAPSPKSTRASSPCEKLSSAPAF